MMNERMSSAVPLRRAVLLAFAAGLSVAAAVAIAAVLTGSFDRTDLRLVGTSLGFSVFSALGAAGARADRMDSAWRFLGRGTMAGAGLGFALLVGAIWISHADALWRCFGAVALATLAASHASVVVGAGRPSDSVAIARLAAVSVLAASIDSGFGVLAISGAIKHVDSGFVRLLAVLVIVMLLTTALPPILRKLQPIAATEPQRPSSDFPRRIERDADELELLAIADYLDELADRTDAADASAQITNCATQIRRIARRPKSRPPCRRVDCRIDQFAAPRLPGQPLPQSRPGSYQDAAAACAAPPRKGEAL